MAEPTKSVCLRAEADPTSAGENPNTMKIPKIILTAIIALFGAMSLHAETPPAGYPEKCVVSDEKLGEHGKPVKVTHDGTDVYLCCKMCKKDFDKDPAKYTKMVKEASASKK